MPKVSFLLIALSESSTHCQRADRYLGSKNAILVPGVDWDECNAGICNGSAGHLPCICEWLVLRKSRQFPGKYFYHTLTTHEQLFEPRTILTVWNFFAGSLDSKACICERVALWKNRDTTLRYFCRDTLLGSSVRHPAQAAHLLETVIQISEYRSWIVCLPPELAILNFNPCMLSSTLQKNDRKITSQMNTQTHLHPMKVRTPGKNKCKGKQSYTITQAYKQVISRLTENIHAHQERWQGQ